jgi:hypothetical protein
VARVREEAESVVVREFVKGIYIYIYIYIYWGIESHLSTQLSHILQ